MVYALRRIRLKGDEFVPVSIAKEINSDPPKLVKNLTSSFTSGA